MSNNDAGTAPQLALVSGATGGIGRCIVSRLWDAGYSIVALGRNWQQLHRLQLLETKAGINNGQRLYVRHYDVTKTHYDELAAIAQSIRDCGGKLQLLVAAHGAAPVPGHAVTGATLEAIQEVLDVDVTGTFRLCQLAGRFMLPHGPGSVVIISSIHAKMTYPHRVPYCVSKAAIGGMVRALAVEWGQYNINVNAILPWQVTGLRTEAFIREAASRGEDLLEQYQQRSPQRRLIPPEEVAETVLFLAQNRSISGQELVMDGGVSSSMWFKPFTETSRES